MVSKMPAWQRGVLCLAATVCSAAREGELAWWRTGVLDVIRTAVPAPDQPLVVAARWAAGNGDIDTPAQQLAICKVR